MIECICPICGTKFKATPYRINKAKNPPCCSQKCMGISSRATPEHNCANCGKEFHIKPFRDKRANNKYCSNRCKLSHQSVTFSGCNNHQYGLIGSLNPTYRSDFSITKYGYIKCITPLHPYRTNAGHTMLHRLIMEEYLNANDPSSPALEKLDGYPKKILSKKYDVHHFNEIKTDNRIENLKIITRSEHTKLHNQRRLMNTIKFKKTEYVKTPFKKYPDDAGHDLHSAEDVIIPAKSSVIINTGICVEIPHNHVGLLWSRSGLSVKNRLEVGAGCIDETYRGEIKVHIYNYGDVDFKVNKNDRICQILFIPINLASMEEVEELPTTDRGEGGLGSTGV